MGKALCVFVLLLEIVDLATGAAPRVQKQAPRKDFDSGICTASLPALFPSKFIFRPQRMNNCWPGNKKPPSGFRWWTAIK